MIIGLLDESDHLLRQHVPTGLLAFQGARRARPAEPALSAGKAAGHRSPLRGAHLPTTPPIQDACSYAYRWH